MLIFINDVKIRKVLALLYLGPFFEKIVKHPQIIKCLIRITVSILGCPKNLVDSECILTQLRTEGYDVTNSYDDAELVIVKTCGFIDSAVQESLDTIGEALAANGKVLVTGFLGVTGANTYDEILAQVHEHVTKLGHNPFIDLVAEQGVKSPM